MEVKEYCIDCGKLNDKEHVHEYLKTVFDLPDYYGNNLDALHDCLTEKPRFILRIENADKLEDVGRKVLFVLADAAEESGGEIRMDHSEYIGRITPEDLDRFIKVSCEVTRLEKLIEGTELKDRIDYIRNIYCELKEKEDKFRETFDVSCRKHCCECCRHFMPDIMEAEADYMAFGIIAEGRADEVLARIDSISSDDPPCLMLRQDDADHPCTEYQWRPLICRLFGDAASKDKEGRPAFRKCKWNVDGHDVSCEEMEKNPDALVSMSDYGMRMEDIDIDSNSTLMMGEALKKAIEKVRFIISLKER